MSALIHLVAGQPDSSGACMSRTDGTFSRSDFSFEPEANHYTCPAGKHLLQFRRDFAEPRTGVTAAGTRLYRGAMKQCGACDLKPRCCPNMVARKIQSWRPKFGR